ncbi:MAG: hypothetical protein HGA66_14385, partial [Holophaga sp.]|nr:hypothetical protein [Holophaga sp.]
GIAPEEFYRSTLREVSIRIEGTLWQQEQAARLSLREAWYMAALMRQKKLPPLKRLLRSAAPRAAQSPEAVRQNISAWAAAAGLRLHRRPGAPPVVSNG